MKTIKFFALETGAGRRDFESISGNDNEPQFLFALRCFRCILHSLIPKTHLPVTKAKKCPACRGTGLSKKGVRCKRCSGTGEIIVSQSKAVLLVVSNEPTIMSS